MSKGFYVTLVSNASEEAYPDNNALSFTNDLAYPIDFPPEEHWRVCLHSLSMQNSIASSRKKEGFESVLRSKTKNSRKRRAFEDEELTTAELHSLLRGEVTEEELMEKIGAKKEEERKTEIALEEKRLHEYLRAGGMTDLRGEEGDQEEEEEEAEEEEDVGPRGKTLGSISGLNQEELTLIKQIGQQLIPPEQGCGGQGSNTISLENNTFSVPKASDIFHPEKNEKLEEFNGLIARANQTLDGIKDSFGTDNPNINALRFQLLSVLNDLKELNKKMTNDYGEYVEEWTEATKKYLKELNKMAGELKIEFRKKYELQMRVQKEVSEDEKKKLEDEIALTKKEFEIAEGFRSTYERYKHEIIAVRHRLRLEENKLRKVKTGQTRRKTNLDKREERLDQREAELERTVAAKEAPPGPDISDLPELVGQITQPPPVVLENMPDLTGIITAPVDLPQIPDIEGISAEGYISSEEEEEVIELSDKIPMEVEEPVDNQFTFDAGDIATTFNQLFEIRSTEKNVIRVDLEQLSPAFGENKSLSLHTRKNYNRNSSFIHNYQPGQKEFFDLASNRLDRLTVNIRSGKGEDLKVYAGQPTIVVLYFKRMEDKYEYHTLRVGSKDGAVGSRGKNCDFLANLPRSMTKDGSQSPWEMALSSITYSPVFDLFPDKTTKKQIVLLMGDGSGEPFKESLKDVDSFKKMYDTRLASGSLFNYSPLSNSMGETAFKAWVVKKFGRNLFRGLLPEVRPEFKFDAYSRVVLTSPVPYLLMLPSEISYCMGARENIIPAGHFMPGYWLLELKPGKPFRFSHAPDLKALAPENLMVYADCLEESSIGGAFGQLLTTFPLEKEKPDQQYFNYEPKNLEFHRVNVSDLTNIRFTLRTLAGEEAPFRANTLSEIYMSLMFRRLN